MAESMNFLETLLELSIVSADVCKGIDTILESRDSEIVAIGDMRLAFESVKALIQIQSALLSQSVEMNLEVEDHLTGMIDKINAL